MMYVLDAVNDAISKKRKIKFVYNRYGTDFKLHPKREAPYIVNPYQIVANNSHFYLIGNYDKYDDVSHYRLDKMTCVSILDEKVKPQKEVKDFANGFHLPRHMAEHIYMFSGSSVPVKLRTDESMMNELVDWLGKDFRIRKIDEDGIIEVVLYCNEDAMFYWALQYGPYVEILEPESLRERLKSAAQEMYKKYTKEGNPDE
jgi:predicted DNA-binding transcriptional regulator YafY